MIEITSPNLEKFTGVNAKNKIVVIVQ